MTEEKYLSLIHKKLSGNINSTELTELINWLSADKVNQQILDDYESIWKLTESVDDDFDVDIDQGFNKLQQRIKSEQVNKKPAKLIPMRRRVLQLAAALALLLGAGFLFNLYNTTTVETNWVSVTTSNGEKKSITLTDGTIVSINQNSSFRYPENFTSKTRSVELSGEAFFDVARDESKPFIIDTEKTQVTVLGTSFNVREYKEELITEVMVKTGKVKFSPKNNNEAVQLTAFKKGVYFHTDRKLKAVTLDHLNDVAWHSKEVKFKRTPLKEVIQILNRQLNCNILIENQQLLSCKYNGNFSNLKLDQIANAISISFGASTPTYNNTTKQYSIKGGDCVNQ